MRIEREKINPLSLPLKVRGRSRGLFPEGFLWGASTSAYQVEGGITQNDWAVSRMPPSGLACDHYNRYKEDFLLAKKLGQNAQRISLEWSRIEPEKGKFDERELEHYHQVLKFLKDNGFKTFVTLHHFTNPVWFAKLGGFEQKRNLDYFKVYVLKVAEDLGEYIDFWITINEPTVYAGMAYNEGKWPPFKKNIILVFQVYRNMLEAHNRAYDAIHKYYPNALVGFAQNIWCYEPANPRSFFDRLAVKFLKWVNFRLPFSRTKNDFLGLNHYFYGQLHFSMNWSKNFHEIRTNKNIPRTDRGWPIYPEALYQVLLELKKFHKPIYITENGLADSEDLKRADYIQKYLGAVAKAIEEGVDVRGYLHWSLLDCFEWEDGYKWKFGLLEVDFATQERRIRSSAEFYAKICKQNFMET